jgi:hypothetical protein
MREVLRTNPTFQLAAGNDLSADVLVSPDSGNKKQMKNRTRQKNVFPATLMCSPAESRTSFPPKLSSLFSRIINFVRSKGDLIKFQPGLIKLKTGILDSVVKLMQETIKAYYISSRAYKAHPAAPNENRDVQLRPGFGVS